MMSDRAVVILRVLRGLFVVVAFRPELLAKAKRHA